MRSDLIFAYASVHSFAGGKILQVICENAMWSTRVSEKEWSRLGAKVVRMHCGHSPIMRVKVMEAVWMSPRNSSK